MTNKSRYNANFSGTINYGQSVVLSIISLATSEIKGVTGLCGKGVRTKQYGTTINVDVSIGVYVGCSCADIAYRVQENIKRSIESMTTYKIGVVNVSIMSVKFKEEDNGGQI